MTNKAFYEYVINANLSAEVTEKAKHLLELANNKTDKRAEKATANQTANLEIFKGIANLMKSGTTYAVSEIKALLTNTEYAELSTAKLSAVFKLAVENGLATTLDGYKVGGKGRAVKGYILTTPTEDETEDETED